MTLLAWIGLINGILSLVFGLFVLLRNPKARINITYFIFDMTIALFNFGYFFWQLADNVNHALFWFKILTSGIIFINVTFLHVSLSILGKAVEKKKLLIGLYLVNFVFLVLNFKLLLYTRLVPKYNFGYWPIPTKLFSAYLLFWFCQALYGIILLYKGFVTSIGHKKEQIRYFMLGCVFGLIGGATNWPLWFNINFPPYLTILIAIHVPLTAYAIYRYHLLDINLALTRAGIFAVVYTLVLGIPFWFGYKYNLWMYSTWIMLALATLGPFIYLFLQRRAEAILRKEQLQYQEELRDISSTMMLIKELDRLLKTIVLKVVDIVQVSWAGVYLKDEKAQKYFLRHQRAKPGVEAELPQDFPLDSALIKHLYKERLPIIGEEIGASTLKIGLAVPCFIEDNLLGFLLLGDKPKGGMYTISDVNTFAFLANQTALAIENCQFYSQERQREHFRRIASLDRQIDCMAHEMDNPIHATLGVLGSIDIALDELKELIPAEKMEYLKQKLSRVEFNAKRVSKMVSAVKEFTKPTTGEFAVVTLQHIISSFVAIINPQIHHYGINFTLNLPTEPVWLRANKVEIEQVLVNLGTNSVQAIKEAPKENKKEITLKAYPKDDSIVRVDFQDTGSGIEERLLEDIFLDFVTTKASSEGTGLGLSISRKIIQRHKGKIWAESEGENLLDAGLNQFYYNYCNYS